MTNMLLLIPGLSGSIFVVVGLITFKFPPKRINPIYGYRTSNSMFSQERWDFAQTYAAVEMIKVGVGLTFFGFSGLLFYPNHQVAFAIGMVLLISSVIVFIYRVETAINRKFGKKS